MDLLMQQYLFVTTFNHDGFKKYGERMIDTFLTNWPNTQRILVYTENFEMPIQFTRDPRLIVRDISQIQTLTAFKNRNANNPKANGYWPDENQTLKNFKFDAVRFSHKVFALYDASHNLPEGAKAIVWLDGDTVTHRKVPENFIERIAPRNYIDVSGKHPYGIAAYLGRVKQYSECGFVVYNCKHPMMKDFWETFINLYITDELFNLQEWHDSFIFDHVRKIYEARGMKNHNLTPRHSTGHPFINCELGDYMDHMKGARKQHGRSKKNERVIRTSNEASWWK